MPGSSVCNDPGKIPNVARDRAERNQYSGRNVCRGNPQGRRSPDCNEFSAQPARGMGWKRGGPNRGDCGAFVRKKQGRTLYVARSYNRHERKNTWSDTIECVATKKMSGVASEKGGCTTSELWEGVDKFVAWLDNCGYASYDPYDVWGSRYGLWARQMYYEKHAAGVILTAPLILMEIINPRLRRFLVKKDRFPTADAQLALAFLNLSQVSRNSGLPNDHDGVVTGRYRSAETWLLKAKSLCDELLTQSVPGYSGFCWGYPPFDWQNLTCLMPKGTPNITATLRIVTRRSRDYSI